MFSKLNFCRNHVGQKIYRPSSSAFIHSAHDKVLVCGLQSRFRATPSPGALCNPGNPRTEVQQGRNYEQRANPRHSTRVEVSAFIQSDANNNFCSGI